MAQRSIVEYFAEHEKYRCGYCKSKDTNYSHGMWAHQLTVEDYQYLIDRGWRRSGKYVYKPTMNETCCPQYTIRCEALKFKMSKSQKKVMKRVHKYLNTGDKPGSFIEESAVCLPSLDTIPDLTGVNEKTKDGILRIKSDTLMNNKTETSTSKVNVCESKSDEPATKLSEPQIKGQGDSQVKRNKPFNPGRGADPTKPPCKKAKQLRLERKLHKLHADGRAQNKLETKKSKGCTEKSVEDFLTEVTPDARHKLEVKLLRSAPRSTEFSQSFEVSYSLFKKYQKIIHKEADDECTVSQFTSFLVDSPLKETSNEGGFGDGFGSFHQQYWLDGKLIAVGVLDILPRSTSSVYLYYDPDYSFLSLGTYSALREAEFTRHMHTMEPSVIYYYMGFYIHTCPKMIYKGSYDPSYLLCPETYDWFPIAECSRKLDVNNYCRFAPPENVDKDRNMNLDEVLVLHSHQLMPYAVYRMLNQNDSDEQEVQEYAGFVGATCSKRIALYRA